MSDREIAYPSPTDVERALVETVAEERDNAEAKLNAAMHHVSLQNEKALAQCNNSSKTANTNDARGADQQQQQDGREEAEQHHPGAFPVQGNRAVPSHLSSRSSASWCQQSSSSRVVVATWVNPREDSARMHAVREEGRRAGVEEFLAQTTKVTAVPVRGSERSSHPSVLMWICAVFLIVAAAVVTVTVKVAIQNDSDHNLYDINGNEQKPDYDDDVLVALRIISSESSRLPTYAFVETRLVNKLAPITTGVAGFLECKPILCFENDFCAIAKHYQEGCCADPDSCAPEDLCGEWCDLSPDNPVCTKIDQADGECTNKNCYECKKDSTTGQDIYSMREMILDIDCLDVGEYKHETDEKTYRWAVICGAVTSGSAPQNNYGLGEYACMALDEHEHRISSFLPCQWIQLGECGCAPADVETFGLPSPNHTCQTEAECPYLCADAGKNKAKNLCRAFGGLDWWYGDNFFSQDVFAPEGKVASTFYIYVKELDGKK